MRHYYGPLYRQVADPVEPESHPAAPNGLQRERVPALIDALDCLLALWVAEATLDAGARPPDHCGPSSGSATGAGAAPRPSER